MRELSAQMITEAVRDLFIQANRTLPSDACALIEQAQHTETNPLAKSILEKLTENLNAAKKMELPICQDTGMAVLFAEVGSELHINGNFEEAIAAGVRRAYVEGRLRASVVRDPLYDRVNTTDNTPPVLHTRIVPGDRLRLIAAPKGFGSENMSALKMFTPAATEEDIIRFVCDTVEKAGGNPCPPVLVGVGIGGTFEYAAYLAKRALTRPVSLRNPDARYAALEEKMLNAINQLQVGAQGFGGDVTAFAVNVEQYPTHIAGLPVAVNINCHVMRHAECEL